MAAAIGSVVTAADAQTTYWIGPAGQSSPFAAGSNWSDGAPNSAATAYINNGGTALIAGNDNDQASSLYLGGADGSGSTNQSGGVLNISNGLFIAATANSSATVTVTGGTLATGTNPSYDDHLYVGYAGSGTLTQTGGTISSDYFEVAEQPGSTGIANLSGGTLTVAGGANIGGDGGTMGGTANLNIGGNTALSMSGGIYVYPAGTVTASGGTLNESFEMGMLGGSLFVNANASITLGGPLYIAENAGYTATMNMSGGTLNANTNSAYNDHFFVGYAGSGTLTQTGGTINCNYFEVAELPGSSGTATLSGGTLNISGGANIGGDGGINGGTALLTVSGTASVSIPNISVYPPGTITAIGGTMASANFINLLGGTLNVNGSANVSSGGALSIGQTAGYIATVNVTGGTLTTNGNANDDPHFFVGYAGSGTLIQTGGTINCNYFEVAELPGSTGVANLSGGTLTAAGGANIGGDGGTSGGAATVNISGSANFQSQSGVFLYANSVLNLQAGTLGFASMTCFSGSTYNQSGGTLTVSTMQTAAQSDFQWTGGTININGPAGTTIGGGGSLGSQSSYLITPIGLTDAVHTSGGISHNTPYAINAAGQVMGEATRYVSGEAEGDDAWLYSPLTGNTVLIGLTDATHTSSRGARYNDPEFLNSSGLVVGTSYRYGVANQYNDGGYDAWIYSPSTGITTLIGLTDTSHVETGGSEAGYAYNEPIGLNDAGQAAGYSDRYSGSTQVGVDAWLYSAATGTTTLIGLTDAVHTSGGYSTNRPLSLNQAGQVTGTAERFGAGGSEGQDAWLYSSSSGTTTVIGLTDAAHTETGGYSDNYPQYLNAAGQVAGQAERYSGSTYEGYDAWLYSPTTGTTSLIGLTDAAHTSTSEGSYNAPVLLNSAGQVAGYAYRYSGNTYEGDDAWLYSPATGKTTLIGLTDAAHTETGGYSDNYPQYLNAAGQVAGETDRYSGNSSEGVDAWVYDSKTQITYDLFQSQSSTGYADSEIEYLGDDGTALGYYYNYSSGSTYTQDAFIWTEGGGFHDLGTLVQGGLTAAGWESLAQATEANTAGDIIGYGNTANGSTTAFILTRQTTIGAGMTLNSTGPLTVLSGGHLALAGGTVSAPSLTVQNGGIFDWSTGTLSVSSGITISAGGLMNLLASTGTGTTVHTLGSLAIQPNTNSSANGELIVKPSMNSANRQLIVINSLSLPGSTNAWQGLIDLSDNDMDLPNASLATITNQISDGYSGGNWNGSAGIISSSAAADTTHLTALGVIQNNQSGSALFNSTHQFDGTAPGAGDILIKYTYYGDANLDGKVDGTDYSRIDNGYLNHLTGWFNGDFN